MSDVLIVILARAGSKGLPDKCVRPLAGRTVIDFTFDHAIEATCTEHVCLSTDSPAAARLAQQRGIAVIDRPAELAADTASVQDALRHAVSAYESAQPGFSAAVIVLLYGNVPLRPPQAIDRAVDLLRRENADCVRTLAPVSKQHPDWLHRLDGTRMTQFRPNTIHRRQDLEPLYYHDGAVLVVKRDALFAPAAPDNPHAFLGRERRALVVGAGETIDIDEAADLREAEARLTSSTAKPIVLAGRAVGPGQPPFVIAEAGVNHNGDVHLALRLIDAAKAAGADAVKFQAFSARQLTTAAVSKCDYQQSSTRPAQSQQDMLAALELSLRDFERLAQHAAAVGIHFLATPFGIEQVQWLAHLRVPAIKIASTDLVNRPLLEAAAAVGCPLIVSTGAAEPHEIDAAVNLIRRCGVGDRLVLLHCVSSYPTPVHEANLRAIAGLIQRHGLPVGYSDHTTEICTGALAVAAGACVVEKHLTLNRAADGPDHAMSLDPAQFSEYVIAIRTAHTLLGTGNIELSPRQRETRHLARARLVTARTIRAGDVVQITDVVLKRAGAGLEPQWLDRIVGTRARTDIPGDTPIQWADLEFANSSFRHATSSTR